MMFNDVEIKWKGHSGFLISALGKKIYIDPYKLSPGSGEEKADIILITHSHYDHCSIEDLSRIVKNGSVVIMPAACSSKLTKLREKLDIKVMEPGKEIEIMGIGIKPVPSYNVNKDFHAKSEYWNGYVIIINGTRIYHAGDTDLIPEMSNLNGQIDLALLPVGGIYTMNPVEAAKACFIIKPEKAIPMHFNSVVGTREDAERFVDLCKEEGIDAEILEKE